MTKTAYMTLLGMLMIQMSNNMSLDINEFQYSFDNNGQKHNNNNQMDSHNKGNNSEYNNINCENEVALFKAPNGVNYDINGQVLAQCYKEFIASFQQQQIAYNAADRKVQKLEKKAQHYQQENTDLIFKWMS